MRWTKDFKDNTIYRLDESTRMIWLACAKVNEQQIWQKHNRNSNSIGNLILHLCGNMKQYVIASLGELEDSRERNLEFSTKGGLTKMELLEQLTTTVNEVKCAIINSTEEQLLRKRNVQGFNFSGMGCVIHSVEHYSYHTGQIAFWVKQLVNGPLGFYDGLDLEVTNDERPITNNE